MKTLKILVAAGLTLASAASLAAIEPGTGIKATKHDWSASQRSFLQWCPATGCTATVLPTTYQGTGYVAYIDPVTTKQGVVKTSIGMCTTCHTPHQARSTNLLWNHTLLSTEYEWNVPATTAGTNYPKFKGDTYKGASTKCLSCHDGLLSSTDGMWFNRQKVSTGKYTAPAGSLDSGHEVADGAEMSGSHPVAFPYPYGNAPSIYNGSTTGAQAELTEFVADPSLAGVRLFNDDGTGNIVAGASAGRSGMECTSCHDVHNGAKTQDVMLLRGKLVGSDQASGYICTQCHKK
jgi:nitrate reductase cytochrome c-type subunit